MHSPQVTTAGLMSFVLFAAVGFGLLKNASPPLARLSIVATAAILAWAGLRACFLRDHRRCARIGQFGFGAGYLILGAVLAYLPPLVPSPPARLLDRLESAIGTTREFQQPLPRDRFDEAFSEWSLAHPDIESPRIVISETDPALATIHWTVSYALSFRSIVHCLLALCFASLGGLFFSCRDSSLIHRTRRSDDTPY